MKKTILLGIVVIAGACMGSQNRPMQLINGAGPVYPGDAKAAGIEGEVVVRYDVNLAGEVVNVRVEDSEPLGVFDEAALAAVRSWRYNPQIRTGVAQPVENVLSTLRFRLDDEDAYDGH